MLRYRTDTPPVTLPAPATVLPGRDLHNVQAGVVVPLAQAGISGLGLGLVAGLLAYTLDARHPLVFGLAFGILSIVAIWLLLLRRWLVLTAERITHRDINSDGVIGPPKPRQEIKLDLLHQTPGTNSVRYTYATVKVSRQQLILLARGLAGGRPFSEAEWSGTGKPFSRPEFRELRAEMVRRDLVSLASEAGFSRQGYILTDLGKRTIDRLAKLDLAANEAARE